MPPALVRLHNLKLGEPSTSTYTRETEGMRVQSLLYSRSTIEASVSSGTGGLENNTIIFIVIGVVCLLVILIGFYLVSRPRATSNATPSVHSSLPQHSAIIHPARPRRERDMSERWKIWKIWRHTGSTDPPVTPDTPTSQASHAPAMITSPSQITPDRGGSKTCPPSVPRPSQARRVTSLSVTTSFSHSHITDEALNNFRLSAYDLDDDLEVEMLNSATDDIWPGHVLAVEDCCEDVGVEEAKQTQGNATVGGSAGDYVPPRPMATAQLSRGGDYENAGARQSVASDSNCAGDMIEVDEVAMGRQALQ